MSAQPTDLATDFPWPFKRAPLRAWTHDGILCAVAPSAIRGVNGYCRIPDQHPWANAAYEDLDVRVHYGLTYGNQPEFHFMQTIPARTREHTFGWIGWDTGHYDDCWTDAALRHAGIDPTTQQPLDEWNSGSRRWYLADVVYETERLAEQIAAASSLRLDGNPLEGQQQ